MDVKPDPKPGRWILPLVIVAMVGFTYVFVNSIDLTGGEPGANGVDISSTTSTSMPVIDTSTPGEEPEPELDPEMQAYVDAIGTFDTDLQRISDDFVTANTAWDDDTATFSATVDEFESLISEVRAWSGSVASSNPPTGHADLVDPHQAIKDAAAAPLTHAQEALDQLRSSESGSGDRRRTAVGEIETAAATFSNAVTAAVEVASR